MLSIMSSILWGYVPLRVIRVISLCVALCHPCYGATFYPRVIHIILLSLALRHPCHGTIFISVSSLSFHYAQCYLIHVMGLCAALCHPCHFIISRIMSHQSWDYIYPRCFIILSIKSSMLLGYVYLYAIHVILLCLTLCHPHQRIMFRLVSFTSFHYA